RDEDARPGEVPGVRDPRLRLEDLHAEDPQARAVELLSARGKIQGGAWGAPLLQTRGRGPADSGQVASRVEAGSPRRARRGLGECCAVLLAGRPAPIVTSPI